MSDFFCFSVNSGWISDALKFINSFVQCINPNWHEGWYLYLLVLFGSDFVSWIFIKNFQTFFEVKIHCGFLEHWNSQKSVCNIWQWFSCLLDERIPKIWKKLNSHGGFLRADQGRAKMCCQMGWIGCAI